MQIEPPETSTDAAEAALPAGQSRLMIVAKTLGWGCGGSLVIAVGLPTVLAGYLWYSSQQAWEEAARAQQRHADEAFSPVADKLSDEARKAEPVDIDKTVRTIREVDLSLQKKASFEEYLQWMARQDYEGVAPEVLESRTKVLKVLQKLYSKQVAADQQEEAWEFASQLLLTTFSVVSVNADAGLTGGSGGFSVDREQAAEALQDLQEKQAVRAQLQADIQELQGELLDAMFEASAANGKYLEEWDQISLLRDRAYLAAVNGDWAAAKASASLAAEKAPLDREAHLIEILAMIEEKNPENEREIDEKLDQYLKLHADASAPALLLLGVHEQRRGHNAEAQLALQQSAAYYPRQAEALTDMLDPYKWRSFLGKSREGGTIIEMYESTMLGAGYFSPDLQLARMAFEQDHKDEGKAKVLDHFARRRAQQQWDFILSDVQFCQDLLGPAFWEIFPEDTWLDLEVSPTMMGSQLNLAVENRSPNTLRNATLILVIHLTDQFPGEYSTVAAPNTVPAILPHDTTSFGTAEIALEIHGKPKGVVDIVSHRAIVVSDEAVTWVDTDEFKLAELKLREREARVAKTQGKPYVAPAAERHPEFGPKMATLVELAQSGAKLGVSSGYGQDDVTFELPRELAILRPTFALKIGDQIVAAGDNRIEEDKILVTFPDVSNFDDQGAPEKMAVVVGTVFGDIELDWDKDGVGWALHP